MAHGREKTVQSTHVSNRNCYFANGRPFVFEQGSEGLGSARQKGGAEAELGCSANRKEEADVPEGKYRK